MPKTTPPIPNGSKFGKLTIVSYHHSDKRWRKHYTCICECGKEKIIHGSAMVSGNTRSCGCISKETAAKKALPENGGVVNQIILQYKRHARSRNIPFLLEREEVDCLIRQPCYYCGEKAGNNKITKNCKEGFRYNGIDRKDSSLPYQKNNVVPCCGVCNKAKGVMTDSEFINWAKRVAAQWG
jgi:hypothetical protein